MNGDVSMMDCRIQDHERGKCEECGEYHCDGCGLPYDGPEIPQMEGTKSALDALGIITTKKGTA